MGFEDVIAVEEWHFAIRLNPNLCFLLLEAQIDAKNSTDFVLCVLSKIVESSDMQLKLATFCEFAKAGA